MSRAASLPGAELFLENCFFYVEEATCPGRLRCLGQNFFSKFGLFLNKPHVPGSFAAWGRTFSQKMTFVEQAFAAWGRTFFSKYDSFLNKPLSPGSFATWGRTFFSKNVFVNKPLVPGSFAAWGRTSSQNMTFLLRAQPAFFPG